MIQITATRLNPVLPLYRVTFEGQGKVLQILLELLKIGARWNTTAKLNLDSANIDTVVKQIVAGK